MRRTIVIGVLIVGLTGAAQAALFDRGNGLIYDDVLNVTWLQEAGMGGELNWADANTWAADLTFGGYDDWRQPSMDLNGDELIVDCSSASEADCQDNELGYMYYYNLGGMFGDDLTGAQGMFTNIRSDHWSGTEFAPGSAWVFGFVDGFQFDSPQTDADNAVWAVRPGDVLAVPDTDKDGFDDSVDSCLLVANPAQRDTDADGIGNVCDPDVAAPNDCFVNFLDLNVYRANFFQAGDLDTDNTGDGITNFLDLNIVRNFFFTPPGPSANGCN